MRLLLVGVLLLGGCDSMKRGFKKGYDRSFLENCQKSAIRNGATAVRAKAYCDCGLAKVNAGASLDDAATSCK